MALDEGVRAASMSWAGVDPIRGIHRISTNRLVVVYSPLQFVRSKGGRREDRHINVLIVIKPVCRWRCNGCQEVRVRSETCVEKPERNESIEVEHCTEN